MPSDLKEIIDKIKAGDKTAFRTIVEEHQQYVFSLAFRILCNEEEARDAVQESFVKIWKHIKSYDTKMKFTTWIYKIVTNTAIDRLRKLKKLRQVSMDEVSATLVKIRATDLSAELDNRETAGLIRLISNELPEKQKLVFVLRDLQEMDTTEVAEMLRMDATAIKSNLFHARKNIRNKLSQIINYERVKK
jgi:RNA polymerase sigma-70 factor (ECF subfamily)